MVPSPKAKSKFGIRGDDAGGAAGRNRNDDAADLDENDVLAICR
jgi:hypothetical protein